MTASLTSGWNLSAYKKKQSIIILLQKTSLWRTFIKSSLHPLWQMEGTVHHLAVVGCASRLETPRNLWNCGANGQPALEPGYPALTPCHSEVGERHTPTCKRKQILTGLLFHFSVTGQHDQHIVFMEPWRQGGHVASRHRLPCRRGLQSSVPCASGELWTFFPSSLLFLANSFSHMYPIIKKGSLYKRGLPLIERRHCRGWLTLHRQGCPKMSDQNHFRICETVCWLFAKLSVISPKIEQMYLMKK